ncbi:VOC family protein [Dermacoccaceae bacterium W4C1]
MSTHETAWPLGVPCWARLTVEDPTAAGRSYGHLFGWDVEPGPDGDRGDDADLIALKNGRPVAALAQRGDGEPAAWTVLLSAPDLDAALAAVQEAGGTVASAPVTHGEHGRSAVAMDPTGAAFGLWEAGTLPGFGVTGEPGSPALATLLTRDLAAASQFYARAFGLHIAPGADGHATVHVDPQQPPVATLHQAQELPEQVPAHWLLHLVVASRDATVALVEMEDDLDVVMSMDSPFGAEATVSGAEGEVFNVVEPPEGA